MACPAGALSVKVGDLARPSPSPGWAGGWRQGHLEGPRGLRGWSQGEQEVRSPSSVHVSGPHAELRVCVFCPRARGFFGAC